MKITLDIPDGKYCNPDDNDCHLLKSTRDENLYCSIFSDLEKDEYLKVSGENYNVFKHPKCIEYCSKG